MSSRYTSHRIPKQNSKGFRIIHEFNDIDKHEHALNILRKYCKDNPKLGKDGKAISLSSATHGYPYGNKNMIALTRNFNERVKNKDKYIVSSFDLSSFYHFITKDFVKDHPKDIKDLMDLAFVDIGNGIEVLAQGSPLSQDISNISLLPTDLRAMTIVRAFNTWSRSTTVYTSNNVKIGLPHGFSLKGRSHVPTTGRGYAQYFKNLTGDNGVGDYIEGVYASSSNGVDDINEAFEVSYMRYVDNIYIGISAIKEVNNDILEKVSAAITRRIKGLFLGDGFQINNLKNSKSNSKTNRKVPILGMNISDRVKCNRHYLNGIRAGLWNFTVQGGGDIPQSLASSAIYALYVDPKSHNRLRKCTDLIREMDLRYLPNARSLIAFIDRKNKLTSEIPRNF
jgi:hypothetical protein